MPNTYSIIVDGRPVAAGATIEQAMGAGRVAPVDPTNWQLDASNPTAFDIVDQLDDLLEAVVSQLGAAGDADTLIDGLSAILRIDGPEAVLPLATLRFGDRARIELTGQARSIGETLVSWVRQIHAEARGRKRLQAQAQTLAIRSRCDGHTWTPGVIDLLMGRFGGRNVMQLYNEWQHQLVLLRDSLLPFANWADVPLPRAGRSGGFRYMEKPRQDFVGRLFTERMPHAAIAAYGFVHFSDRSVADDLYGFQTEHGFALPALLGPQGIDAPHDLLIWHPASLAGAVGAPTPFVYAAPDYLDAAQPVLLDDQADLATGWLGQPRIEAREAGAGQSGLHLALTWGDAAADVGQIGRGQRFAYDFTPSDAPRPDVREVSSQALLALPGLVSAETGNYLIVEPEPVAQLLLVGTILPGNTILARGPDLSGADAAGKAFGARFIIDRGAGGLPTPTAGPAPLLRLEKISKAFGGHPVLVDIDLSVAPGEVVVLIGASGSGKTTLLRCINWLDQPDAGSVALGAQRVDAKTARQADILALRRQTAMVFQQFNLFRNKTVIENIMEAPVVVQGREPARARDEALALLSRMQLSEKAGAYPSQLSGGQQQRVAIARALALDPALILFDEPTSALDPERVGEVLSAIREIARSGATMLISTHEMGFAREVADRIVFLDNGHIEEQGPPEQIFDRPRSARTRQFLQKLRRSGDAI